VVQAECGASLIVNDHIWSIRRERRYWISGIWT
jgi:hypothetical protein